MLLCQLKYRGCDITTLLDAPQVKLCEALARTHIQPKTVRLRSKKDFDPISHQDMLIEYLPGGEVGDGAWRLQYMHNMSVLAQSQADPLVAQDAYVKPPEAS